MRFHAVLALLALPGLVLAQPLGRGLVLHEHDGLDLHSHLVALEGEDEHHEHHGGHHDHEPRLEAHGDLDGETPPIVLRGADMSPPGLGGPLAAARIAGSPAAPRDPYLGPPDEPVPRARGSPPRSTAPPGSTDASRAVATKVQLLI